MYPAWLTRNSIAITLAVTGICLSVTCLMRTLDWTAPLIVAGFYTVAFVMQAIGVIGVAYDVLASIRRARKFRAALVEAEGEAVEHRNRLAKREAESPIVAAVAANLPPEAKELMLHQGPAGVRRLQAVVDDVLAQNDSTDRERWVAVGLVVGGIFVGFLGNLLSLPS